MQVLDTGLIILTLKLTKTQPVLFDRSIDAMNGCVFDEMKGPVTVHLASKFGSKKYKAFICYEMLLY